MTDALPYKSIPVLSKKWTDEQARRLAELIAGSTLDHEPVRSVASGVTEALLDCLAELSPWCPPSIVERVIQQVGRIR